MVPTGIAAALLILNSVSALPKAATVQVAAQSRRQAAALASEQYESTLILGRVRSVLSATGYTGRLTYSGECQKANGLPFVAFPKIDVHRPESDVALRAMRQIFHGNASVTVAEEHDKIISIIIGAPLLTVLGTRIALLRLAPLAQYNPFFAIGAIEDAKEVRAEMVSLKLHAPPFMLDMLVSQPSKLAPHLPRVIKNVSVEKALSLIAMTFNGMIVYGTCRWPDGRGLLEIYFIGLDQ